MSGPSKSDHDRYAVLVNAIRLADGLGPLAQVMPVDDPRPYNAHMEAELNERGAA